MIRSRLSLFYLFGVLSLSLNAVAQQTPEQQFFEWTTLPFSKTEYADRRTRLIDELARTGGGLFLCPSRDGFSGGETFRQLDDFMYLTGLELPNSMLVLDTDNREVILFTPSRDQRFENASRRNDFPGRPLGDDPLLKSKSGIEDIRSIEALSPYIARQAKDKKAVFLNTGSPGGIKKLQSSFVSTWSPEENLQFHLQQTYPSLILKNAYSQMAVLRMIKSAAEIETMHKAADITTMGITQAARFIKSGVDERTLEAEMEAEFKKNGSPRLAFASIIKSGPNSLWPWRILASHYERRNRKMENGELVIFDVGCEYNYYSSDVGRTFPVSGKFSEEQKRILEMEVAVSDAIIAAIKPGVTLADLKKVADAKIPATEKKYMQVGLFFGHHIGLSTGDPNLSDTPLKPGMIFTVEPWYYNHDKEIAVFTEDEILVTETGAEVLTKSLPRTPGELEKLIQGK